MPITNITRRIAPRIDSSGIYIDDLDTAGTVTAMAVPPGAIAVLVWFENSSEEMIRGRVGFAGEDHSATTDADDDDETLGHFPPSPDVHGLPAWAKYLHVACSTANAVLYGTWFYD